MIRMIDIATSCGVSVSTVSKVLHGYSDISSQTAKTILDTAERLGYRQMPKKPAAAVRISRRIGLLIMQTAATPYESFYFDTMIRAFSRTVDQRGYSPLILYHSASPGRASLLSTIRLQQPDGLCIIGMERLNTEIRELLEDSIPVVCVDYLLDRHRSLLCSQEDAVRYMLLYCRALGHTDIAWLDIHGSFLTRRCHREFRNYIREMGLPDSYALTAAFSGSIPDGTAESEAAAVRERLQHLLELMPAPTCILCSDDFTAYRCISELRRFGVRVPEEISVAGLGACSSYIGEESALTSVDLFPGSIGAQAAQDLADLIEEPSSVEIRPYYAEPELVTGKTVADRRNDA